MDGSQPASATVERYDAPAELARRGVEHFDPRGHGFGFLIEIDATKPPTDIAAFFDVREITSRTETHNLGDGDGSVIGSEFYLRAYMNWDSCMHVWFRELGDKGYLHLCGVASWTDHVALLKRLYVKAFEVMGREPEGGEEWPAA